MRTHLSLKIGTAIAAVILAGIPMAQAASITYNDAVTAIFGSGNPDGGWATHTENGIQVGLRMKNRQTGDTTNTDGVYPVQLGYVPPANNRSWYNVEYTINSDAAGTSGLKLNQYSWTFGYDTDPTQGVLFSFVHPIFDWPDLSLGDNSTPNGQGVENFMYPSYSVGQNSQNLVFPPFNIDPTVDATYDFLLRGSDYIGNTLAETRITAVLGNGGAPVSSVPDGGTTALLLGMPLAGLVWMSRRQKRIAPAAA